MMKLKIVVAEDDLSSSNLISIQISEFADWIHTCFNGHETVEFCRNHPEIDLILMDIQMPEMSGYEATRQIRSFNPDVVIIAQTAYALSGDSEKAFEAGCNDYISKPIRKNELERLIKKHFAKIR